MEVIRRHPKGMRPGSLMMAPGDRIFNPSRETDRLLSQAERIGPHTFSLCEKWFNEEGRSGQRRMYGLVNLVRHYPARYVEKAAELGLANGLKSSKAMRRIVESMAAEADTSDLTQEHPLIRSGEDYALFWEAHAAGESSPEAPISSESDTSSLESLTPIAHQASWLKVIDIFGLEVDPQRSRRDDDIWIKSPFTQEEKASMHVSLSENIYKDFSSGKGGGIIGFCRDMLRRQGQEMTMFEVARWMVAEGISTDHHRNIPLTDNQHEKLINSPITIDLRRYLRPDHPEMQRRGISPDTCRYLGCGFLPQRSWAKTASPLNSRLVFQIRGIKENGHGFQPVILSHTGRAMTRDQEDRDGKYWSYPFKKSWELYNQDRILMDEEAWRQANTFGLVLVEGFFDVAKLVEAGCRNTVALMGSAISEKQIDRLLWMQTRVRFPNIQIFLDRDPAGQKGMLQVQRQLASRGLSVTVFDWSPVPESVKDPADMSVDHLRTLRRQGII